MFFVYSIILLFCLTTSTSHYTRDTDSSQFGIWSWDPGDTVYCVQFALATFILLLYVVVVSFFTIALIASKIYLHKPVGLLEMGDVVPGVSIIKPLVGVQPQLEHNLETHFKLTYPKFELIFCFHDDQDEAISLVHKLQQLYPHVDVQILTHAAPDIVNPMVQNIAPAYEAAKYDYIWISSSRVEVSNVMINDMTSRLQKPNVALVHQIPFTTDSPGFGSMVEKIYFGSSMAKFYITFNMLGLCCVTGMSYIFKKSLLEEVNGYAWYGRYLAEDYFLTSALHKKNRLVMSAIPARQNVGPTTVSGFVERMVRWLRLRLNMMVIVAGVLEPMAECFPLGLMMAWALHHFFSISLLYFLPAHIICWMVVDYNVMTAMQNGPVLFSKLDFVKGWVFRELTAVYIYISAIVSPHYIKWGYRIFHVHWGGLTKLVKEEKSAFL